MIKSVLFFFVVCLAFVQTSCYRMRASKGGGEIATVAPRATNPSDVLLMPGYKIEVVADRLTFPSGVAFDNGGGLYVIETGYSYGEVRGIPKLMRIDNSGARTIIAQGSDNGPWNGVVFHDNNFYVAEGGVAHGGKILKISPAGEITTLVDGLPSVGDHHTNALVVHDGHIYFGQGTATNSAVVGEDNANFGWLKRQKKFHDIPCKDIVLTGENYESPDVLTPDPDDKALTGAFVPFGTKTSAGQVIKGSVPCTGAILRIPLAGGRPEAFAWGLRNPFGIAVSQEGKLFTTENAFDDRGSRPVWGAGDVLWEVREDTWYGWPDYSEGKLITFDEEFKAPSKDEVRPLLQRYPSKPPTPVAVFGVHSSACGLDFSRNSRFGYEGEAFVAEFGDMAPGVGKVEAPVGFKIVRVNTKTGVVRDFAVNRGKRNGPASWLKHAGLERPVSVKFDPSGESLYVVDFGIMKMTEKGPQPQVNTGVIWKITKQ